eukprot:1158893-Pelagomonas_calceolata.AAC.1
MSFDVRVRPCRRAPCFSSLLLVLSLTLTTVVYAQPSTFDQAAAVRGCCSPTLLPFKNVEYTIGAAEALSFFLRLSPPVLCWSVELSAIVSDALELAKLDEAVLLAQLPPSRPGCACTQPDTLNEVFMEFAAGKQKRVLRTPSRKCAKRSNECHEIGVGSPADPAYRKPTAHLGCKPT